MDNIIEFGDIVEITTGADRGIIGRLLSMNAGAGAAVIDRNYKDGMFFQWFVDKSRLKLIAKSDLINPDCKFTKEDLLAIIDQDKTAEEVVLDLRDHITN